MSIDTAITMLIATLVMIILTSWLIIAACYHDIPCIITVIILQISVVAIAIWGIRGERRDKR